MPLASSRSSTKRAAKARKSLPSTIQSTTKVTKSKAMKRRASLRSKRDPSPSKSNKENNAAGLKNAPKSPGPTPYWKVKEENGDDFSPRLTRSAQKKQPRLPPAAPEMEQRGSGFVLNFSPPDQEANSRREKEELARKEQARARRIEEAKRKGHLLTFSAHGDDPIPMDEEDEHFCLDLSPAGTAAGAQKEVIQESGGSGAGDDLVEKVVEAVASQDKSEKVASELKDIRETMTKLLEANSSKELMETNVLKTQAEKLALEAQLMQNQQVQASNSKLEEENNKLQVTIHDLESNLADEKEKHSIEKTRLEGEVNASKREFSVRVQGLEESRKQLEQQLVESQKEKAELNNKVSGLEKELIASRDKLAGVKSTLEALRAESQSEAVSMSTERERLVEGNSELKSELAAVAEAKAELEGRIAEYEEALDSLENKLLPESELQLKKALSEIELQKEENETAENKLKEANDVIQQLKTKMESLEAEKEEERINFQKLNEESSIAFEKMTAESDKTEQKVQEMSKMLSGVEQSLSKEQKRFQQATKKLEKLKTEMNKNEEDFEAAMSDMKEQLESSEAERKRLEAKLEKEMKQVASLLSAKDEALNQCSDTATTLERMQKELQRGKQRTEQLEQDRYAQQHRMKELEGMLHMTEQERNDARSRMDSFDTREEELFRKLRESDRVRRMLHNKVMQLSGNIRVYVRVRPVIDRELEKQQEAAIENKKAMGRKRKFEEIQEEECPFKFPGVYDRDSSKATASSSHSVDDLTKNLIEMTEPYKDRGGLSDRRKKWRFGFDHVFAPTQGQQDVWEATEPLVQSAVDGYNVCIFAYGQTGSGKTYTMLGEPSNEGIISRAVDKLFAAKDEMETLSRGSTQVNLSVELLEVYNEQVRDLLVPNSGLSGREISLKVTSEAVVGNKIVPTSSKDEVMDVLELAQKRRCVRATQSNDESSRSHMLFTIHFEMKTKDGVSRTGKLHVCDLAGSERLGKSGANSVAGGSLLKETQHINKSLSVLSNVIERLQAGNPNVPFRESKLTYLLQNSLGGNSKTLAIVCCNPLSSHFHESLCSLRFAAKVNKIDLKATAHFSC